MAGTKTKLQCPSCDKVCKCEAFEQPGDPLNRNRRYVFSDEPDIRWFRRLRRCSACGHEFETSELPHQLVDELRTLRQHIRGQYQLIEQLTTELEQLSSSHAAVADTANRLSEIPLSLRLFEMCRARKLKTSE